MRHPSFYIIVIVLLVGALSPASWAQCPGQNLLANPDFEGGAYRTMSMGTSLSSYVAEGWVPWQVWLGTPNEREVEYSWIQAADLGSWYRVHGGNHSQKFFTSFGTHSAGFYQRVRVQPGATVQFSIWVQIYTGQRELRSGGEFISDLDSGEGRGPGNYKAYVGIDPTGNAPSGFGAPPAAATVWSAPLLDRETRQITADGRQVDAWTQLTVSTVAQSEYVTVYVRGQPEFPVVHNDSFWDDACLVQFAPPTPTPRPTSTPTDTPAVTNTPTASATPVSTATPTATETPVPTDTPAATDTPVPTDTASATRTPQPTSTVAATAAPSETAVPAVTATQAATVQPTPSAPLTPLGTPTEDRAPFPWGLLTAAAALILVIITAVARSRA